MNSYFPPLYGKVDCAQCEAADCWCRGKYQRDRRDFTHTSGRCPRLPDKRGFVERSEHKMYAATFPLVHAELGGDTLYLTLMIPGQKRSKKVYRTKSGFWYYKETIREEGADAYTAKRVLTIEDHRDENSILDYMERLCADYILLRCTVEDYFV